MLIINFVAVLGCASRPEFSRSPSCKGMPVPGSVAAGPSAFFFCRSPVTSRVGDLVTPTKKQKKATYIEMPFKGEVSH